MATIRFGTSRFHSPLSPDQILLRMQQLTTPKRWLRNPFASIAEPFEGEIDTSGFDLTPLPQVRSNRPIPNIRGSVLVGSAGETEVSLELFRPGKYVLAGIILGAMAVIMLVASIVMHDFFLGGFSIFLFWQLSRQRFPNQYFAAKSIEMLKQQLQLTPILDSPTN